MCVAQWLKKNENAYYREGKENTKATRKTKKITKRTQRQHNSASKFYYLLLSSEGDAAGGCEIVGVESE